MCLISNLHLRIIVCAFFECECVMGFTARVSSLITLFICLFFGCFLTDARSSLLSIGAHSLAWDLDNERDINDGEYAHVPGLKKKR